MMQFFNHLAHYAIGFYVGVKVAQRDYAPAAFAGAFFGIYQVVEAWRKKDEGYPEIKEGGVGFALGVACYRGYAIFLRRKVLSARPNQSGWEKLAHGTPTDIPIPPYTRLGGAYEAVCACFGGSGCGGGAGVHSGVDGSGAAKCAQESAGNPLDLRLSE